MKRRILGIILGVALTVCTVAIADPSWIGVEAILNRVFDSTNNALQATVSGVVSPDSPFEVTDSNVIQVDINTDIETAIAAATAGDTIVLAAGTYTITDDIDIAQAINVVGQGVGQTTVTSTTAGKNIFHVTSNNVRLADMTISHTANGETATSCVKFDGSAGTELTGCVIENCDLTMTATTNINWVFHSLDASGVMRNCTVSGTSASGYAIVTEFTQDTTAGTTSWNVYDSKFTAVSGATAAYAATARSSNIVQTINVNFYNCTANASGVGNRYGFYSRWATNGTVNLNAYGCTANGTTADVKADANATLTLYDTTLVNNTTSGTITYGGTVNTLKSHADGVVTSTNFKKCSEVGALTIWISDGTTAEGALTGVEGDICLNGGTGAGQMAYCDAAGTNWTDM